MTTFRKHVARNSPILGNTTHPFRGVVMLPVGNCLLVDLNQNPTAWVNWLLKELNDAHSVSALAAILQTHNREINQLRAMDPVRVIHISNLIQYRKQIEGLL